MTTTRWLLAGFFFLVGCQTPEPRYTIRQLEPLINHCMEEQVDLYGDTIGEGDDDFESVLYGVGWALNDCIERHEAMEHRGRISRPLLAPACSGSSCGEIERARFFHLDPKRHSFRIKR